MNKTSRTSEPPVLPEVKVALVHDWLTGMRGGEKVLEVFCELFPSADLFTLLHVKNSTSPTIENRKIIQSFLGKLPGINKYYRWMLPLMPTAAEQMDLSQYDLVFSSSHCVAKSVKHRDDALSLCYCHTPMRYVWERFDDYFGSKPQPVKALISWQAGRLRRWDRKTSGRVHGWIANSSEVRRRIISYYPVDEHDVSIIFPPVDISRFKSADQKPAPSGLQSGGYDLVVSALVAYKKIDLAVIASKKAGNTLVVIGKGPEKENLLKLAEKTEGSGKIIFPGAIDDDVLPAYFAHCRAFLFPGLEDFGITPLEATAAGRPVVAFKAGGALDTVVEDLNGIYFNEQSVESLVNALSDSRLNNQWDKDAMLRHAESFDRKVFKESIAGYIADMWQKKIKG